MPDKRTRDKSLTIRLTALEKKLLTERAENQQLSVTDYILLSSLTDNRTNGYNDLCKQLSEIRYGLDKLKDNTDNIAWQEALDLQREAYAEVMKAICRS